MRKAKKRTITEDQWKRAADAYERGTKHGVEIAADLGVSPATVSREFKRRRCKKASRVAEIIAPLEAELDRAARRRAIIRQAQENEAAEKSAVTDRLIAEMMRSIIAASKAGDLTKAAPTIEEVGRILGVKPAR